MRACLLGFLIACASSPPPAPPPTPVATPTSSSVPTCPKFQVAVCVGSGGTGRSCTGYRCIPTGLCALDADCPTGNTCACQGIGEELICAAGDATCEERRCGVRHCVAPGEVVQPPP